MDLEMTGNVGIAFFITLLAGLATGIGSILAFVVKKTNMKFLSAALGFSAGVMIFVSFVEIYPKAYEALASLYPDKMAALLTLVGFFGGMLLIALIDKLVPDFENPHTMHSEEEIEQVRELVSEEEGASDPLQHRSALYRMGVMSALAIAIHNFPEGLATFTAALRDPTLGISIAVAIAIHNIPEGIAVSIPLYFSTGSKRKAFLYSFLSGLAEPVGALAGYLLLSRFFNDLTFGLLFSVVAGIMVYISLDELLPASEEYGEHHVSLYGLISGMLLMGVSLILFK